jgi:hypothetical protein
MKKFSFGKPFIYLYAILALALVVACSRVKGNSVLANTTWESSTIMAHYTVTFGADDFREVVTSTFGNSSTRGTYKVTGEKVVLYREGKDEEEYELIGNSLTLLPNGNFVLMKAR